MTLELRIVDDPAQAAAELLGAAARPGAQLALSGGGTVAGAYELAARLRPDWRGVDLWFGDERAVPPDDGRSNHRLVCEHLVELLEVRPEIHRVRGELDAAAAAALYDAELDGVVLDLALNGIGSDGHTASLFPLSPALDQTERHAVAAAAGLEPFVDRVTMTRPVFAAARLLVYLVTGEGKADAVRRAFAAVPGPETPASLVRGVETIALLDEGAASLLGT